jgi:Lipocalin-like domain
MTFRAHSADANALLGVWKLASWQVIVGNEPPRDAFGLRPKGFLILTREGRSIVLTTAENRRAGTGDTLQAAMHRSMLAYSGKYRVEGDDFITAVDVSWNEEWNGTEQRRHFRLEGDRHHHRIGTRADHCVAGSNGFPPNRLGTREVAVQRDSLASRPTGPAERAHGGVCDPATRREPRVALWHSEESCFASLSPRSFQWEPSTRARSITASATLRANSNPATTSLR